MYYKILFNQNKMIGNQKKKNCFRYRIKVYLKKKIIKEVIIFKFFTLIFLQEY